MHMGLTGVGEEKLAWSIGDQVERTTDDLEHVRLVFGHFERSVQVGIELMAVRRGLEKILLVAGSRTAAPPGHRGSGGRS